MGADGSAHVEDHRAGEAEMGEQEGAAPPGQRFFLIENAYGHVRQRYAAHFGNPGHVGGQRDKGRTRRDNAMAEPRGEAVAVAGGAEPG